MDADLASVPYGFERGAVSAITPNHLKNAAKKVVVRTMLPNTMNGRSAAAHACRYDKHVR